MKPPPPPFPSHPPKVERKLAVATVDYVRDVSGPYGWVKNELIQKKKGCSGAISSSSICDILPVSAKKARRHSKRVLICLSGVDGADKGGVWSHSSG